MHTCIYGDFGVEYLPRRACPTSLRGSGRTLRMRLPLLGEAARGGVRARETKAAHASARRGGEGKEARRRVRAVLRATLAVSDAPSVSVPRLCASRQGLP
mmetsp:Transcript_10281/g.22311  ORF Transcript_10281/g.22311 Transcript_10281/m.22311 type:complete len:100 (+) Transcript_10281:448-747(+)